MKVLFIGGTGNISASCTSLAAERGIELVLFRRGTTPELLPSKVKTIVGDIRDRESASAALRNQEFEAIVDFVAYLPDHVETDIALFRGRTRQYVFISSASVYEKPPAHYVVTESTPVGNPFWQYARDKIACEERLERALREEGFPFTIVRPSYTYGETWIPTAMSVHDYTIVDRMRKGKKIISHGDGQSLWTLTHASDFAKGLIGLLGNPNCIGERYHITSDEVLTWDRIYREIGSAAGVEPDLIHIPSDFIAPFDARVGASLLGDKSYSQVFDNTKIKQLVPSFRATVSFAEGIRRSVEWFEADPSRQAITQGRDDLMDRIIATYKRACD